MAWWTCPECGRGFGRRGQGHECAPAMTLEEYFATGPARERPIFEAVHAHLASLGDVLVEPVSVGILFKRARTFVELRPMVRWEALSFLLPQRIEHPRITRHMGDARGRGPIAHVVRLMTADDVDEQVCEWLTASFAANDPPVATAR